MVYLYTDGSCNVVDGKGGWAWLIKTEGKDLIEKSGWKDDTTNNQMELTAILQGISYIQKNIPNEKIIVYSDSELCIKCATGEYKRRMNLDLWEIYDHLSSKSIIEFVKVKGHSTDIYNQRVDFLANKARKRKIIKE